MMAPMRLHHRIYLSPGFFGFGKIGSYDYFSHVEKALVARLNASGDDASTWVLDVPPTASIRRRASRLAELVSSTAGDQGPVHLIGHSTGGLDARMLASPEVILPVPNSMLSWMPRLASVTTINAPHYGTPLASFFATANGQRWLYLLSVLTYVALTVGAPPLTFVSAMVLAMRRIEGMLGLEVKILDGLGRSVLRLLDDAQSAEVRAFLEAILTDQGAVIQLMPEAMDLFHAGIGDRPGVVYQCTASMAPPPSARKWLMRLPNPWETLQATIFTALYGIASRYDETYPCAPRDVDDEAEARMRRAFGRVPGARSNDGVVPILSQVWGKLVWVGYGDHLDVLGHFHPEGSSHPERPMPAGLPSAGHVDWLRSGSGFNEPKFETMIAAIGDGVVAAAERWRNPLRT
jgi:pimeloyl-ACP methyl ester carboxylesterase